MAQRVRPCSGAGFWFPQNPGALKREVDKYLKSVSVPSVEGRVVSIISPHAGYTYCGEVMGMVYNTVKGKNYERVILLAISHSYPVKGLSVLKVDAYETPLGQIPVDKEMRDALFQHSLVEEVSVAHSREHSDENQLPFLQLVLEPGWKMVSIFVGDLSPAEFEEAAKLIRPYVDENTLIVVSSDFTHYGFQYGYVPFTEKVKENLYKLDGGAIEHIIARDFEGFRSYVKKTGATICGKNPIALMTKVLPRDAEGKLVKYMTSGDVTGDYDMAVGYAGILFVRPENTQGTASMNSEKKESEPREEKKEHKVKEPEEHKLSEEERKTLLRLSRDALYSFLTTREFQPNMSKYPITPALREEAGVFVTLTKRGKLRGCIGYVEGIKPLWEAVIDNTRNAAFEDSRFPEVSMKEFDDISIEISVMTPLRPIKSVDEIIIGQHGLVIRKGFHSGLLLPQVPVEWGWNRDEFLVHICQKAGLPPDAWKKPDTKLYVFSAQVFSEEEYPDIKKTSP